MNLLKCNKYGGIAQLGEHLLCKQGVIGSIPIISTSGKLPQPIFWKRRGATTGKGHEPRQCSVNSHS